jgi:hypothetical protein
LLRWPPEPFSDANRFPAPRKPILAKNTFMVADAQVVEQAFERRLTELRGSAWASGPTGKSAHRTVCRHRICRKMSHEIQRCRRAMERAGSEAARSMMTNGPSGQSRRLCRGLPTLGPLRAPSPFGVCHISIDQYLADVATQTRVTHASIANT